MVIPNVMGICLWSPPLDGMSNSVRGNEFCKELVSRYDFHRLGKIILFKKTACAMCMHCRSNSSSTKVTFSASKNRFDDVGDKQNKMDPTRGRKDNPGESIIQNLMAASSGDLAFLRR